MLEQHGPMEAPLLRKHLPHVETSNLGKYCSRAVWLGLMTVERGMRDRNKYAIYKAVDNWRDLADMRRTTKQVIETVPVVSKWNGINSVFSMGAA